MMRRREFLETGTLAAIGAIVVGSTRILAATEPVHDLIVRSFLPENLETPIAWFDRLVIRTMSSSCGATSVPRASTPRARCASRE